MRSAMSMIELVFSIVVMGLAVASLPLILLQTQKSTAFSLEQEVILATKARLAFILSHEWDAFSYDITAGVSRVLDTNSTTSSANPAFDSNNTRRIGHVIADGRRKLRDDKHIPTSYGDATYWGKTTQLADIDDFDDNITSVNVVAADMDYTFSVNLTSKVQYISDDPSSGNYNATNVPFIFNTNSNPATPTNIKMISVTSSGSDSNITLRAFASNIGESTISKRSSW